MRHFYTHLTSVAFLSSFTFKIQDPEFPKLANSVWSLLQLHCPGGWCLNTVSQGIDLHCPQLVPVAQDEQIPRLVKGRGSYLLIVANTLFVLLVSFSGAN